MAKALGITNPMQTIVSENKILRSQSWTKYNFAKKTARERRREFLRQRLLAYETNDSEDAATAVIAISTSEELQHAHREVRGVLKPRSLYTLNHI